MIDDFLRELAAALADAGVRGAHARRVLAEARDHVLEACAEIVEADVVRAFGAPRELAGLIAAEVATTAARTAALATFAVLGVAGLVYAALFLTLPLAGSPDVFGGSVPGLGIVAFAGIVVAPQVAFVSGSLALIRVLRVRCRGALSADELRMQRWRTGVALGAGVVTFVALALVAVDFHRDVARWWILGALGSGVVFTPVFVGLGLTLARTARPRPLAVGPVDDVFDDLAQALAFAPLKRLQLPSHPWRFALLVAAVAAAAVGFGGASAGDPFDSVLRAAAEVVAVLGCYAVLRRPLGLVRQDA